MYSFSTGIDFRRQDLTSTDVRFWRLKSAPALKGSYHLVWGDQILGYWAFISPVGLPELIVWGLPRLPTARHSVNWEVAGNLSYAFSEHSVSKGRVCLSGWKKSSATLVQRLAPARDRVRDITVEYDPCLCLGL